MHCCSQGRELLRRWLAPFQRHRINSLAPAALAVAMVGPWLGHGWAMDEPCGAVAHRGAPHAGKARPAIADLLHNCYPPLCYPSLFVWMHDLWQRFDAAARCPAQQQRYGRQSFHGETPGGDPGGVKQGSAIGATATQAAEAFRITLVSPTQIDFEAPSNSGTTLGPGHRKLL